MNEEAEQLPAALAPEFEVLRVLGTGSVGTAYLAREPSLRRLVTIKVPRRGVAENELVRHRFEREARAAARVRHPSAAAVHRVGHLPDGTPYIVLEYVDGRTLDDVLRAEGPFPLAEGVALLEQVAGALREAHASGVVHRDVRPNNVFWVPSESRAVLSDFGLAGILETGTEVVTRLTNPGERLGHPAYRSPEQLRGEPATPATDIYSLAVLGFELLTGEQPYVAATARAHTAAHLRQPPRHLHDLLPEAPPLLSDLISRCLSKDPHHRPGADSVCRSLAAVRGALAATQPAGDPVMVALRRFPSVAAFLVELKQRRVYNVAFAYVFFAFLVLQGAEVVMPSLPLPPWSFDALVAVTLAGFPLAVALAWMYDVTASGIRRADAAAFGGPAHLRWLLPVAGVVFSLAIAVLIGLWVLTG